MAAEENPIDYTPADDYERGVLACVGALVQQLPGWDPLRVWVSEIARYVVLRRRLELGTVIVEEVA